MAQRAVLPPILRQLDRRFLQIPCKFLQLPFKPLKQRNRVRSRARKSRNHFVLVQPPRLPRGVLHHVIAHGHLPIRDQHYFSVFAHAQDRGSMHCAVPLCTILANWHSPILRRAVSARQKAANLVRDSSSGDILWWSSIDVVDCGRARHPLKSKSSLLPIASGAFVGPRTLRVPIWCPRKPESLPWMSAWTRMPRTSSKVWSPSASHPSA